MNSASKLNSKHCINVDVADRTLEQWALLVPYCNAHLLQLEEYFTPMYFKHYILVMHSSGQHCAVGTIGLSSDVQKYSCNVYAFILL